MADFLNRLAARALGATPLAEPVIPTRFSPGAETNAFLAFEPTPQSTRPFSGTASATSEDRPHPPYIRKADPRSEIAIEHPASPFQDPDEAPHPPLSQPPHALRPQPSPLRFAERETVQPSTERAEVRKQHLATAMNSIPDTVERAASYKPQAISPTTIPFAEPQPTPRLTPLVEPKRSPVMQHPEASSLRTAPPTVRISIGRIEVRAEIASPVPTAPAQRPRPSTISLDQFLKQAGRAR
jgi:hypothetical protein